MSYVHEICLSIVDLIHFQIFGILYGRPDHTQYPRLRYSEVDRKRHEDDMLAFLANLSELELFALQEVNLFLQHMLHWLITATQEGFSEVYLSRDWSDG
jgi:hypothetical protein